MMKIYHEKCLSVGISSTAERAVDITETFMSAKMSLTAHLSVDIN